MRPRLRAPWAQRVGISAGFALLVFTACLVGIYSRMPGTLAAFWPASALLLGLLVRFPSVATVTTWLGAAVGYLCADLTTGSTIDKAILLNSANLVGVIAGFVLVRWIFTADLRLGSLRSVAWLAAVAVTSAATAAVVGAIAQMVLFHDPFGSSWLGWYAEEVLNYSAILPVILTFPTRAAARHIRIRGRSLALLTIFLLGSAVPAWLMAGFGTLAFRMGGEEFALLLPDTGRAGAVEIAERIRSRQQNHANAEFDGAMATVSIGLAWAPQRAVPLSELLVVSDEALYRAKTNRRNTVVVAEITPGS